MVGINFSQETARSVIEQYEFRVDALLKKIGDLEEKLKSSKQTFKN
jgi:hypothetical protein